MEPTRELDQIRSELNRLHDRTTATKLDVTALQATTEQRFEHIINCLEAMKADMESLNTSVASLQTLATEGQTSLKTLLWLGGAIAGISAFLIMLYNLLPK
jgi:chromosome segregation ATPase